MGIPKHSRIDGYKETKSRKDKKAS